MPIDRDAPGTTDEAAAKAVERILTEEIESWFRHLRLDGANVIVGQLPYISRRIVVAARTGRDPGGHDV